MTSRVSAWPVPEIAQAPFPGSKARAAFSKAAVDHLEG